MSIALPASMKIFEPSDQQSQSLVDCIIDNLYLGGQSAIFSTVALISRAWYPRTRVHLFRRIHIRRKQRCKQLLALLQHNPLLTQYILYLEITVSNRSSYQIHHSWLHNISDDVCLLLDLLPTLRGITLSADSGRLIWTSLPIDLRIAFLNVCSQEGVRHVGLRCINEMTLVPFAHFGHLESFHLTSVSIDEAEREAPFPLASATSSGQHQLMCSRLTTLRVYDCEGGFSALVAYASHPQATLRLSNLRVMTVNTFRFNNYLEDWSNLIPLCQSNLEKLSIDQGGYVWSAPSHHSIPPFLTDFHHFPNLRDLHFDLKFHYYYQREVHPLIPISEGLQELAKHSNNLRLISLSISELSYDSLAETFVEEERIWSDFDRAATGPGLKQMERVSLLVGESGLTMEGRETLKRRMVRLLSRRMLDIVEPLHVPVSRYPFPNSASVPSTNFNFSKVPQELINHIIDQFNEQTEVLCTVSLLSRAWYTRTRVHLYHRILLTNGPGKDCQHLLEIMQGHSFLAQCVRALKIYVVGDATATYQITRSWMHTQWETISGIFRLLTSLRSFILHGDPQLDWSTLPDQLKSACFNLWTQSCVENITLFNLSKFSLPLSVNLGHIRSLGLCNVEIDEEPGRSTPAIDCVDLQDPHQDTKEGLTVLRVQDAASALRGLGTYVNRADAPLHISTLRELVLTVLDMSSYREDYFRVLQLCKTSLERLTIYQASDEMSGPAEDHVIPDFLTEFHHFTNLKHLHFDLDLYYFYGRGVPHPLVPIIEGILELGQHSNHLQTVTLTVGGIACDDYEARDGDEELWTTLDEVLADGGMRKLERVSIILPLVDEDFDEIRPIFESRMCCMAACGKLKVDRYVAQAWDPHRS